MPTEPIQITTGIGSTFRSVSEREIIYFDGELNYSALILRNARKTISSRPLGYYEKLLPHFIRVHKCHLVNPAYIKMYEPGPKGKSGRVVLNDGTELACSRRRIESIKNQLNQPV